MTYPLVILGGGLSGLAAAIRFARFGQPTLILEKHTRPGGLNSFYYRNGMLFETGLHAMTNFAPAGDRRAPLNRLFRQLKLSRNKFITREQVGSEIIFPDKSLRFSNDLSLLHEEVCNSFPDSADAFMGLVNFVKEYDPFKPRPWHSARQYLHTFIKDQLLIEMLLCPLMIYGNSEEHDMDFSQFVIMFQAVFLEGFFRPAGSIKNFLDMLLEHYLDLGGEIRFKSEADSLITQDRQVIGVGLKSGEEVACEQLISTVGLPGTKRLLDDSVRGNLDDYIGRMSFVESIYQVPAQAMTSLKNDCTCIFYSLDNEFAYCRPEDHVSLRTGVINFPAHFRGTEVNDLVQIRVTHPANYDLWLEADAGIDGTGKRSAVYEQMKSDCCRRSIAQISKIVGNFEQNIVYQDTFTPLTIEQFSGKQQGAVYGSPLKIKDGCTEYENLFVAGTDQGFLGIVGAMLSGVTIVNNHILTREGK